MSPASLVFFWYNFGVEKGINIAVLDKQDRVLVLKRSQKATHFPNTWNLPGGRVDSKESLHDAAIREVKEETSLRIELVGNRFSIYYYPDGVKKGAVIVIYALKSNLVGGKIKLNHEHSDYVWVSKNDWQALNCTPSCEAALKKLFKE